MGFILMAEAQRFIDQLKNDHDLVDMMRFPTDNPITRIGDPSGSEEVQPEGITKPEKPEIPPPQIGSPGGISTQPEISRTPGRTSIPNPLYDSKNIYDYEEVSEDSRVTPVQITEEKEPEKASTPGPDAPSQRSP